MIRSMLLAAVLAAGLAGCAGLTSATTPAQAVYEATSRYEIALTIAVQYEGLPRCRDNQVVARCSAPAVVDVLRKADIAAKAALDAAQRVVRDPAASKDTLSFAVKSSKEAINAFSEIVQELGLTGGT